MWEKTLHSTQIEPSAPRDNKNRIIINHFSLWKCKSSWRSIQQSASPSLSGSGCLKNGALKDKQRMICHPASQQSESCIFSGLEVASGTLVSMSSRASLNPFLNSSVFRVAATPIARVLQFNHLFSSTLLPFYFWNPLLPNFQCPSASSVVKNSIPQ